MVFFFFFFFLEFWFFWIELQVPVDLVLVCSEELIFGFSLVSCVLEFPGSWMLLILLTRLLNFVYFWMPFLVVLVVPHWFFILIRVVPFKCIGTWINFHVPDILKIFHLFSMFLVWNLWHEVYWLIWSFMYNYLKRKLFSSCLQRIFKNNQRKCIWIVLIM